jgi:hypothetical protein
MHMKRELIIPLNDRVAAQQEWFPDQTELLHCRPQHQIVLKAQATALHCIASLFSAGTRCQKQAELVFEVLLGVLPRFVTGVKRNPDYVPVCGSGKSELFSHQLADAAIWSSRSGCCPAPCSSRRP